MPINLSNNIEFSERPQIAASRNGIFIVWTDTIDSNNKEIIFTKSIDNGKTFSNPVTLSNNSKNSYNVEISAFDENVYVVWQEQGENNNNTGKGNERIIFKSSIDSGTNFNDPIELTANTDDAFPKINSYGNNVYIVWNNENKKNSGLFFIKSSDKGNNFSKIIELSNDGTSGESQITVNKNEILVVWGGFLAKNIDNIYYVKSNDNGNTFTNSKTFSEKTITPNNTNEYNNKLNEIINNPLNVEVTNNDNLSYVVWQNTFSKQNQDILLTVLNNQTGNNFIKLLNLSNNTSISECPSIAISNNNVYVIWEDFIAGNHEILIANIVI